jgi:transcriptional regulator with XRE-family HTH domain
MTLGEKLKKLRLEKKMTLQDVAQSTGYSKALISRIENDSVSPSIGSLRKITAVLEIKLHELFAAIEGGRTSVIRKNSRKSQTLAGGKIKVEGLCQGAAGSKMDAVIKTFESGATSKEEKAAHAGEEWWYVLKGRLETSVGETTLELNEGDSVYVVSPASRKWRNPAKGKTSALVVRRPAVS